jgi:hypothetical protein
MSDATIPRARIAATLALLTPSDAQGVGKLRIGTQPGDGAYVMLDMLRPAQRVLSFGIGRNVSFDLAMAERGHAVLLYDHTIEAPPAGHPQFRFHRIGLGAQDEPDRHLLSLATHVGALPGPPTRDMILKMDVEGAEWPMLAATRSLLLNRFEQIVLEIHGLARLDHKLWHTRITNGLRRLRATHTLVHVHANNQAPPLMVQGFPVSNLLELTWVRSDLIQPAPSRTLYPTALDEPNARRSPDTLLWFHPFLPLSLPPAELQAAMDATLARIAAQEDDSRLFNQRRAAAEARRRAAPS